MARFHGPKIVTDGLVLYLDAANVRSYPGSGTIWTDLSGQGNNGTLTNGPTFNANNAGSIVFDGTNDYVALGTPSSLDILGNLTLNFWINATSIGGSGGFNTIYENGYDGTNEQTYFRFYSGQLQVGTYSASALTSFAVYAYGSTIVINNWYNIVGQYDGTNWKLYLNGNLVASSAPRSGPQSSSAPISIGGAWISNSYQRFFNGNIAQASVYNRALSADEIRQNFNATRGRFGV